MRRCRTCTVCCELLGLPPLEKPPWTRCTHQCRTGCTIYGSKDRPAQCGDYSCLWLLGLGPNADRPDRLGVVFDMDSVQDQPVVACRVKREDAEDGPRVRRLIDRVRRSGISVVIITPDLRQVLPAVESGGGDR